MRNRIIYNAVKSGDMKFRTRLITFFLASAAIIMLASIYAYISSQILMRDTSEMFQKNLELTGAYSRLSKIQNDLELYLSTGSSDSLLAFYDDDNAITDNVSRLIDGVTYTPRGVKIKNAANMITDYMTKAESAINAKRGRNIDAYVTAYEITVKECAYITVYMEEIMSQDIVDSAEKYQVITARQLQVTVFNNLLILFVMIYVIVMIIIFSFEITKPITKLASYANEISKGNFEIKITPIRSSREVNMLYSVFGSMAVSVKDYVNELQEKRKLESTINEQKVNNLKMRSALHESELLALQSQVNPHFIFNTINIGAKIAMLQGDEITCTYLENAADIFRYNLNGLDSNATLREEIDNVVAYMYLLKTRFSDRIQFFLEIDETDYKLLNFVMPRMILQPIVENAYIHGIGEIEEGGTIRLIAQRDDKHVYLTVSDNGKGIGEDKIAAIINGESEELTEVKPGQRGHTTGIGVDNVIKRLRLYFGKHNVMQIECTGGETKFTFILPVEIENGGGACIVC
jgi:two-component system, sensor histidine kinase YesM